jgi:hypothetical protein
MVAKGEAMKSRMRSPRGYQATSNPNRFTPPQGGSGVLASDREILRAKKLLLQSAELRTEALGILHRSYLEARDAEMLEYGESLCRCKHKRRDHADSYSVNYTGGVCRVEDCLCLNYLGMT